MQAAPAPPKEKDTRQTTNTQRQRDVRWQEFVDKLLEVASSQERLTALRQFQEFVKPPKNRSPQGQSATGENIVDILSFLADKRDKLIESYCVELVSMS